MLLQGTDTSGKDGTIRAVFSHQPWEFTRRRKAPSEDEHAYDYLWRIHRQMPGAGAGAGEMMISNCSHYEDVLVPVVKDWITPGQMRQRYAEINDFEHLLEETGTVILKFMLHISLKEQGARLQERIGDPSKRWKFSMGGLEMRKQWSQYQNVQGLLNATSTPWAPWTVVPTNSTRPTAT